MQSIETVPSPSLDFTGQKTLGVVASTNHVEIAPKYGGIFRAGDIIRLEIPSQNWFDGEKFRITFRGKTYTDENTAAALYSKTGQYPTNVDSDDGNHFVSFKNGVQHCFNRIKLLQGSRVIEDIQEYGQLAHILNVVSVPEDHSGEVLAKEGFGKTDSWDHWLERKIQPTKKSGHLYEVELFLGLFRTGKYLPTKYMGQLTIELYLETNVNALLTSRSETKSIDSIPNHWAAGQVDNSTPTALARAINQPWTAPQYRIYDVNAQCHFIVPIDEYDRAALAQIEAGSFEIHYDTFRSHTRQTNSLQRQTASIQEKALSVKNVFTVMRNQAGLNSLLYDSHYAKNAMIEYQWKIGNEYFPAQPVRCDDGGVRALTQLREALGATSDQLFNGQLNHFKYCPESHVDGSKIINMFPVQDNAFNEVRVDRKAWPEILNHASMPNQFIIGQSFEKSQGQLSGFNTVESQVDIELIFTLSNHQETSAPNKQSVISFQPLKAPLQVKDTVDSVPSHGTYALYNITSTPEQGVMVNPHGLTYFMQEDEGTNEFCQILSFVQVDAILRMRGLGQLEVVS